ncbi:uncharacterized protein TEOVI_000843500 [Trypanosoma equiperdum]|uniref:Uncharacterized protein n=1 Tax=Trypanosoma equiperdum TaxID=5694 RepID=A0A1G4HZ45_TRYEQ|nr:hypothetical protein, conserved [Trypanosoma equiperdum]
MLTFTALFLASCVVLGSSAETFRCDCLHNEAEGALCRWKGKWHTANCTNTPVLLIGKGQPQGYFKLKLKVYAIFHGNGHRLHTLNCTDEDSSEDSLNATTCSDSDWRSITQQVPTEETVEQSAASEQGPSDTTKGSGSDDEETASSAPKSEGEEQEASGEGEETPKEDQQSPGEKRGTAGEKRGASGKKDGAGGEGLTRKEPEKGGATQGGKHTHPRGESSPEKGTGSDHQHKGAEDGTATNGKQDADPGREEPVRGRDDTVAAGAGIVSNTGRIDRKPENKKGNNVRYGAIQNLLVAIVCFITG